MLYEEAFRLLLALSFLARKPAAEIHEPEESAASHCGLYEEHVSVCDMAENPLNQLAVIRDSVHAELNVYGAISNLDSWREGRGRIQVQLEAIVTAESVNNVPKMTRSVMKVDAAALECGRRCCCRFPLRRPSQV
jgi:hypothetical protein